MSIFEKLQPQPEDPILSLPLYYAADPRDVKVNLGVGAYRDAEGKPQVLETVREAEKMLYDLHGNKEYLPIDGMKEFIKASQKLVFGENCEALKQGRVAGVQTVGGSGALSLGAELANHHLSNGKAYLPNPTWPNHQSLFYHSHLEINWYPYYDRKNRSLEFDKLLESMKKMSENSVILLHASCHNPTGTDLTQDQWVEMSHVVKKNRLIPFFDIAYQGFGEGLESDAASIRYFAEQGHEMLVAVSHSKNFGLYGERVGHLSVVADSKERAQIVQTNLKKLIRSDYSSPPLHGGGIVKTILTSEKLKNEWLQETALMRERVIEMRQALVSSLEEKGANFSFLAGQKGFFSYLCISPESVQRLRDEYAIYMPPDSRINVAGLTRDRVDYVAEAIIAVSQ